MDIDCDGLQHGEGDDGRCGNSDDTQSETAFKDTVAQYSNGVEDLNAYVHDYVVFGNYGTADGYTTFDPEEHDVKPLSVMAVVCGDQLVCFHEQNPDTDAILTCNRFTEFGATQTETTGPPLLARRPFLWRRGATGQISTAITAMESRTSSTSPLLVMTLSLEIRLTGRLGALMSSRRAYKHSATNFSSVSTKYIDRLMSIICR